MTTIQQRFAAALDELVEQVKQDRAILAVVLCGSLSHDTVWQKSDIDLVFVTIDDRSVPQSDLALNADGLNVHAMLVPRREFRRMADGALRSSFAHSYLAKGRLLYTHDPTIETLCQSLAQIGRRDAQVQLLRAATRALPSLYKAHKWFTTRKDLDYTALWLLYAATALAQMEVIAAGRLVDREVIPQALALNPSFFKLLYTDLLNTRKTERGVRAALDAADAYLARHAPVALAPIVEHLREVGEARSCRELENHFSRNFDVSGVTTACEYLADQGTLAKVSIATRLTTRSSVDVQELAFFALEP